MTTYSLPTARWAYTSSNLDDFPGFAENHYVYGLLAASIRPIADNLIYSPQSTSHYLNSGEQAKYEASRMDVMLDE